MGTDRHFYKRLVHKLSQCWSCELEWSGVTWKEFSLFELKFNLFGASSNQQ